MTSQLLKNKFFGINLLITISYSLIMYILLISFDFLALIMIGTTSLKSIFFFSVFYFFIVYVYLYFKVSFFEKLYLKHYSTEYYSCIMGTVQLCNKCNKKVTNCDKKCGNHTKEEGYYKILGNIIDGYRISRMKCDKCNHISDFKVKRINT